MHWLDSPIHSGLYSNDLSTLRFQFDEPRLNAEMIAVWSLATAKKNFPAEAWFIHATLVCLQLLLASAPITRWNNSLFNGFVERTSICPHNDVISQANYEIRVSTRRSGEHQTRKTKR
ncbi:MAG: hypothetical protein CBD74_05470, partial [Saprospirales bacterium TMED214]